MSDIAAAPELATAEGLGRAVHQHDAFSKAGLLERLFTYAFRGLVYPQIWEDPVVDMEALAIQPGDHVVAIASGGCNVMSYLTAAPGRITAVDLNHAHIALLRLKIAAVRHLPDHAAFHDFFARTDRDSNVRMFDARIAPYLEPSALRYWTSRDLFGRRRIGVFARGFHRTGLLGRFIGACHLFAKAQGVDLGELVRAQTQDEQRRIFETRIAPLFEGRLLRRVVEAPAALFGLGIPPRQYKALAGGEPGGIVRVLRARVEKLACDFPAKSNYFAWQAFDRRYEPAVDCAAPPYLAAAHFEAVRVRASRIAPVHGSMTDVLQAAPDESADCYVLLDAQDWMEDADLTRLWAQIDRTARPGARVIFRTAADERLLPGRVPAQILDRWTYEEAESRSLHLRDRSSIYGAFHLYRKAGCA